MVTNNVTVYQFEVGLDEVFADEVRFRVNVDCVIVVVVKDHTSSHLFECKSLPTSLSSLDLWTNPDKVEPFLATWGERLLAAT